ncbi:uncharacterized protein LOC122246607 isoform X2 [Penaeus japonicus]|uniref:uncharacterized protein LOC122246607 isoform X2 n=1 Tax=Penaeus japonicus TaxID=27405 RepID=UPI001C70E9BC|nr:uncharacterized protein LOC122246607 isoform X2 [Penaeus japonicus]
MLVGGMVPQVEAERILRENWCHCDLDPCMESVRTAVLEDSSVPECITQDPAEAAAAAAAAASNASSSAGASDTNATAAASASASSADTNTTTAAAQSRKRREADPDTDSDYDYNEENDYDSYDPIGLPSPNPTADTPVQEDGAFFIPPRSKREVQDSESSLEAKEGGMFHPIDNRVVFPGLKVASDYGFDYNKTTEDFGNCTCKPGSIVELRMCLLNLVYTDDLAEKTSEKYMEVTERFLGELSRILFRGLVGEGRIILFRRAFITGYEKRPDNKTTAVAQVDLTLKLYQAEYHVKNGIEPAVRVGKIGGYTTDHEECIETKGECVDYACCVFFSFLFFYFLILFVVSISLKVFFFSSVFLGFNFPLT